LAVRPQHFWVSAWGRKCSSGTLLFRNANRLKRFDSHWLWRMVNREEFAVPRIRYWVAAALICCFASISTGISAQDKGKAAAPATAPDKVNIAWKFEKDKKVYQEMVTKTTQNMKVMNQEVNQTQEMTFFFVWDLRDEDKDKSMTLGQKIDGVKLRIEIAGNQITYDSTNPASANTTLAEFFKNLVGSEFKLTLDKDMKVTKVEGRDEFLKKLGQSNQMMEPLLKKVLNENALKQMADPTFGMVPGKPVGVGESWTRETKLDLGPIGSYKNTYKYTLESVDPQGVAKIKVEMNLNYEAPVDVGEGLPFRIKSAKLASKDSGGSITFDTNKGRLDKSDLRIKLEGDLEIEISGQTSKVEIKQDQNTTISTSDSPQAPVQKKA